MSIDVKDLIKVIRACKKVGVKKLKVADVLIEFGTGDAAQTPELPGETVVPPTAKELEAAESSNRREQGLDQADEMLAHLAVDNPVLYEQMLIEKEFEANGNDGGFGESGEPGELGDTVSAD